MHKESNPRTKRKPRDPGPDREEREPQSDGVVDEEMELDTDKYTPPPHRTSQ